MSLLCALFIAGCGSKGEQLQGAEKSNDSTEQEFVQNIGDSTKDDPYKQLECSYLLKQIDLWDSQVGWAVTKENEVLYTQNGIENFQVVKKVTDIDASTEGFLSATLIDEWNAYITYFASDHENLVVEYTKDGGNLWKKTLIKYGDYAEIYDAGSAFISFADDRNGYLLYCSTPGAGQMTKLLFRTENAGETFFFVEDLTDVIAGYPQGISFASKEIAYIAVNYHGNDNYLYQTTDGAETWESIEIYSKDQNVNYIDCYPPVFSVKEKQKGMLILKEAAGEHSTYQLFATDDMGCSWISQGELPCDSLMDYSFTSDNRFYFINCSGQMYERSETLNPDQNVDDYYSACTSYTKAEVETFAKTVKQQILDKNWEGLSENISYPIRVGGVFYSNKMAFLEQDFDAAFSEEYYDAIEKESCVDMFCNYQGIMMGETGQLWLAGVWDDATESVRLKIIAINN